MTFLLIFQVIVTHMSCLRMQAFMHIYGHQLSPEMVFGLKNKIKSAWTPNLYILYRPARWS